MTPGARAIGHWRLGRRGPWERRVHSLCGGWGVEAKKPRTGISFLNQTRGGLKKEYTGEERQHYFPYALRQDQGCSRRRLDGRKDCHPALKSLP